MVDDRAEGQGVDVLKLVVLERLGLLLRALFLLVLCQGLRQLVPLRFGVLALLVTRDLPRCPRLLTLRVILLVTHLHYIVVVREVLPGLDAHVAVL